jgi:hypothetical protein
MSEGYAREHPAEGGVLILRNLWWLGAAHLALFAYGAFWYAIDYLTNPDVGEGNDAGPSAELLSFSNLVFWLLCVFCGCLWLWRAVSNLYLLGEGRVRHSPGVAIAWCLIPVVNLIGWWFVMDALAARSKSADHPFVSWYGIKTALPVIVLWYLCLSCGLILRLFADSALTQLIRAVKASQFVGAGYLLLGASALLGALMLRQITNLQEQRLRREHGASPLPSS